MTAAIPKEASLLDMIDDALAAAAHTLTERQHHDGSWEDHIEVGPVAVATQLVLERSMGRLSPRDADAGLEALAAVQRDDGSFADHPAATRGAVTITALACEAAKSTRQGVDVAARAQAWLDEQGGRDAVLRAFRERGDVAALYLCAADALPAAGLPQIPSAVVLAPGLERLVDGRVHAGNLMALVVLTAVVERGAPPTLPWGRIGGVLGGVVRGVQKQRALDILAAWQNPSGGWNEALFSTQLMTLGMNALGVPPSDERMARALDWLDARKRYEDGRLVLQAIPNDVWSTAQAALALLDSDQAPASLSRAVQHLTAQQHTDLQPRANQRRRGAVRTGGWAFQQGNPTMPDCDDTGLVLAALGAHAEGQCSRPLLEAIDRGIAWLRDMQNPDGGWPAYVWNLPGKARGPMFGPGYSMPSFDDPRRAVATFVAPPPELGDPATEGVTARVLMGLGACGVGRDDPSVCAAIEFLQAQQCDSGAFWDRWMTCYLPGTATVISGLAAVGEDMRSPYVERALTWMREQQNDDGGFGETPAAFTDPRQAGRGPSMPPVTGFVLAALIDAGWENTDAARSAAQYLLSTQNDDGSWPDNGWVNPYVPPETFYRYALPSLCTPLGALGKLRRRLTS